MATPADRFVEQLGALYLSDTLSDVTIVIGDFEIPAHRVILAQRCQYFQTMFGRGVVDANSRVELLDVPIDGFNSVLQWIYTSAIELVSLGNAFEVIHVAHTLQITELVNLAADYFAQNCRLENVCFILNDAVQLSLNRLTAFAIQYMRKELCRILNHVSFAALSPDALNVVLTQCVLSASNGDIFRAVLNWMRANPAKRDNFPDIMKNVPLSSITLEDLASVPADMIEPQVIVGVFREQQVTGGPLYKVEDENVALYGAEVAIDGQKSLFNPADVLEHRRGTSGIFINLGHRYMLNYLKMTLLKSFGSYWISVSEDNVEWTRIIDHSRYVCRSLQELYFQERPVRYIRIQGSASSVAVFSISHFEVFYTSRYQGEFEVDPESTLLIPSNNIISQNSIIKSTKLTSNPYSDGFLVQLAQPYLLDSMRLCLLGITRYSYNLEVSTDYVIWRHVASEENVESWRHIHFEKQPVVFIKISVPLNYITLLSEGLRLQCPASRED
uniref:BTB domain-containing protein n=1 Tax=Panagrellus redivivus TaxID=6233 RepID=A0A7E4VUT4_PANRE